MEVKRHGRKAKPPCASARLRMKPYHEKCVAVEAEAKVTNTTEPTKVTGQTDPFLDSYYKRRIF